MDDRKKSYTEDEVIALHWGFWSERVIRRIGQEDFDLRATIQDCLQDFYAELAA